jgi:hypothetical protein
VWPPRVTVDVIRWYGCSYDPPLIAREAWWRSTIWSDSLLFGPFYVWAIYCFWVGDERIRLATIAYSGVICTNVFVIMMEEFFGNHATPHGGLVALLNTPWFVVPLVAAARMWREVHPFTRERTHKDD